VATFIAITTSPSNATIRLTPRHLLFRAKDAASVTSTTTTDTWRRLLVKSALVTTVTKIFTGLAFPSPVDGHQVEVVPAQSVKLGDTLFVAAELNAAGSLSPFSSDPTTLLSDQAHGAAGKAKGFRAELISSIQVVHEQGYYNPQTDAANIIVDGVLASCFNEGSSTYGELFSGLPEEMAIVHHWVGDRMSLVTVLRHLYAYVPEWSVPSVAALEPLGGWSHLPAMQRWLFVGKGLLAAAKKLMCFAAYTTTTVGSSGRIDVAAFGLNAAAAAGGTVAAVLLGGVLAFSAKATAKKSKAA
jgi:hypothetical protein